MANYSVATQNENQYNGVFNYFKQLGWNVEGTNYRKHGARTKLYVYLNDRNVKFSSTAKPQKAGVPALTFAQWATVTGATESAPRTASLQLNSSYRADVNYDTQSVTVGGEVIPFSKIAELGDLIEA